MGKNVTMCVEKTASYENMADKLCGDDGAHMGLAKTGLKCDNKKCTVDGDSKMNDTKEKCDNYKLTYTPATPGKSNASVVAMMVPAAVVAMFM
jgi:hypothetical protein